MDLQFLFSHIWSDFAGINSSASKLFNLFTDEGEPIVWDDFAFRTISDPAINIEVLSQPFLNKGYKATTEFRLEEHCLRAIYFTIPDDDHAPAVLISELLLDEVSPKLRKILENIIGNAVPNLKNKDLIFSDNPFRPLSFSTYNKLREESEYAAWVYLFGFRANYISVNIEGAAKRLPLSHKSKLLIENGFQLRTSKGEIRGSSNKATRKSESLTNNMIVAFKEGMLEIPVCFYEFSQQYSITGNTIQRYGISNISQSKIN